MFLATSLAQLKVTSNITFRLPFGWIVMGNVVGEMIIWAGAGHVAGDRESISKVTSAVSICASRIISSCELRFWIVTLTGLVTEGLFWERLTVLGAFNLVTARSCGMSSAMTITAKVHWLLWPAASAVMQVTVLVPNGKTELESGEHAMVKPAQLSEAEGTE